MSMVIRTAMKLGIVPRPGTTGVMSDAEVRKVQEAVAHDAAPTLTPNSGIPQHILNLFNPEIIRVILAPLEAESIFKTVKKGTFATKTTTFVQSEIVGHVAPYGDFSHGGSVDNLYNFPYRESWIFETDLRLGDLEAMEWSEAQINALAEKELAAADTMKRAHNKIWFFGVAGLKNYGILNNPEGAPTITPNNDGTDVDPILTWDDKEALGIFNDFRKAWATMVKQTGGNVKRNDKLRAVISNTRSDTLLKTNEYGVTVEDRLKKAFPNLEIIEVPEYSTTAGEVFQLIAPTINGRDVGFLGYSELIRSHGPVRGKSSTEEKKSAGNWGAVIPYPLAVVTMVGV